MTNPMSDDPGAPEATDPEATSPESAEAAVEVALQQAKEGRA